MSDVPASSLTMPCRLEVCEIYRRLSVSAFAPLGAYLKGAWECPQGFPWTHTSATWDLCATLGLGSPRGGIPEHGLTAQDEIHVTAKQQCKGLPHNALNPLPGRLIPAQARRRWTPCGFVRGNFTSIVIAIRVPFFPALRASATPKLWKTRCGDLRVLDGEVK